MPDFTPSPNMSLPVPTVSQAPGPDWANNYNSCLSILDQHNHAPGSGVQITQDGINLSSSSGTLDSLSFNSTNAFAVRSIRFTAQSAALALGTDVGCIYEAGVDLYYNDGSGNQVRLTQGGSIVGTAGSITGLPSGTASASYSAGTFVWQSATSTAAAMDNGAVTIRASGASANGVTISAPNALAANYPLVLPAALPGSTSLLQVSSAGNVSTTLTPILTTIQTTGAAIIGTTLTVGTSVQIGNGPILTNGGSSIIVGGNIAFTSGSGPTIGQVTKNSILELGLDHPLYINYTGTGIALYDYSPNTLGVGFPATTSNRPVVVSAQPSTNGLMIVRGIVDGSGTITAGEGFTVTSYTSGTCILDWTTDFEDTPVMVANPYANSITISNFTIGCIATTSSGTVTMSTVTNKIFNFVCMGQRKTGT